MCRCADVGLCDLRLLSACGGHNHTSTFASHILAAAARHIQQTAGGAIIIIARFSSRGGIAWQPKRSSEFAMRPR